MDEAELKQKELRKLWQALEKARELNATPNQLVAIRKKIYSTQDELVGLISKNGLDIEKPYYGKVYCGGQITRENRKTSLEVVSEKYED